MALRPRQLLFVKEYLVDHSATHAAIRAGYSKRSAGSIGEENLKKPEIAAAVGEGLTRQAKAAEARARLRGVTVERWLRQLERIAFANFDDFAEVDMSGVRLIPTAKRKKGTGSIIKKVAHTAAANGSSKVAIELHGKLKALELIGKHFGWLKERVEHSGPGGGPIRSRFVSMTDEELQAAAESCSRVLHEGVGGGDDR